MHIVRPSRTERRNRDGLSAERACRTDNGNNRLRGAEISGWAGGLHTIDASTARRAGITLPTAEEGQRVHRLVCPVLANTCTILHSSIIRTHTLGGRRCASVGEGGVWAYYGVVYLEARAVGVNNTCLAAQATNRSDLACITSHTKALTVTKGP